MAEPPVTGDDLDFRDSVDGLVKLVNNLLRFMQSCPYSDRADRVATLGGYVDGMLKLSDQTMAAAGVTAIILLEEERRISSGDAGRG